MFSSNVRIVTLVLAALLLSAGSAFANVEKTIFRGPVAVQIPSSHPTITDLRLPVLSPTNSSIRTTLVAQFPTSEEKDGAASWVLLNGLSKGKRYEVRVCWAATQPTSFLLTTYELPDVFDSSTLVTSLASFANALSPSSATPKAMPSIGSHFKKPGHDDDQLQSILLLQIYAAADYFTTNQTLMHHVPPVLVDIILDPFILNIFPRSLQYTAVYLVVLAALALYMADLVAKWMSKVASEGGDQKKND